MLLLPEPKLTYIRLLVWDFTSCFTFYRDVLELPVVMGDENDFYGEFDSGPIRLALFTRDLMADALGLEPSPTNVQTDDKVALVFSVEDVDSAYIILLQRGARFVAEPADRPEWGVRTAHLRDPDGNLIEINSALRR